MLKLAIDCINPTVIALNFIERYGGLVYTAVKKEEVTGDLGIPVFKEERFPVACGVTGRECWEHGKYQWLVPNFRYKSVAWWEELEGMKITT